jgi:Holliday junction resolvase RusA-like endonuclease
MMFPELSPDCVPTVTESSTASSLRFTVFGTPVPQGSTRAFIPKGWKRPIITADNENTKPWRQEIAAVALSEMGSKRLIEGPVWMHVAFYFERPKSVKKSVQRKITKPDIDKLLRSAFDSLTGIVFKDDSQIVSIAASKHFGSPARMEIAITWS